MSRPKSAVNSRNHIFTQLVLSMVFLVPVAFAQKPPPPAPPPSAPPPTSRNPGTANPSNTLPVQPREDLVEFLLGRVATDDGSPVPHDLLVERVCNARVRQQVYAGPHGDFSMELGSGNDTYVDATADGSSQYGQYSQNGQTNRMPGMGIPSLDLKNCELRASVAGFLPSVVSLVDIAPVASSVNVGAIVVHRAIKVKGLTVSAAAYNAPKDARKAYEKGIDAQRHGRLADARQYFEKAVEIHPKYTSAWFQLGSILQNLAQKESARLAYTRATEIDSKFLPPYLSLASMAYEAQDWTQVQNLTNHLLDLDPLKYASVKGYIVDSDPLDYAEAYFYNSVANYKLNKIADAEKSGLRAERLDVRPRFPQLHLLLAEIFALKRNYATAISETRIYLELAPHAKNADQVRNRLAELEKLNAAM